MALEKIFNFNVIETIEDKTHFRTYRVQGSEWDKTEILLVVNKSGLSPSAFSDIKDLCTKIRTTALSAVTTPRAMIEGEEGLAIVFEDFKGQALKKRLIATNLDIKTFFKITLSLSQALETIHKENIIYREINPWNILWNPENDLVKLSGPGLFAALNHDTDIYNPDIISNLLPYISPELSGRTGRQIDHRTDFYSLGIIAYEALTSAPPFSSSDPMEIIHGHLARIPSSPNLINPSIPKILSDIVMKLIAKAPENRYQSGAGLLADLMECKELLDKKQTRSQFKLGEKDPYLILKDSDEFIGREQEISRAMESFKRISQGGCELLLVPGYPGIGKSSLIKEIGKKISKEQGYFISGKFEGIGNNMPYGPLASAFTGLIRKILSSSHAEIQFFRDNLLASLGSLGEWITKVVPEAEMLIGEQPKLPAVEPEEAQNIFNLAFNNFVKVFSIGVHPLVLFLDDLQWADQPSLNLVESLMMEGGIRFFLLICSYRNNDADQISSFLSIADKISKSKIRVSHINPGPFGIDEINPYLSKILGCPMDRSLPFAELIHRKTRGNPFFMDQFIRSLYHEGLLSLDASGQWVWETAAIEKKQVTDNVIDLMAAKISSMEDSIQDILKTSACIGFKFDVSLLAEALEKPDESIAEGLTEAQAQGLVHKNGDLYEFPHDRIHEAAYSSIPDNEKYRLHLKIGRISKNKAGLEPRGETLFYLVNQMNIGMELIDEIDEKIELAGLNLSAGLQAMETAAYDPALKYFKAGIILMGEKLWSVNYDTALQLYSGAVKAAYITTKYEEMESLSKEALDRARSDLDKIEFFEIKMRTLLAQNKMRDSIEIAINLLKNIGIDLPHNPSAADKLKGFVKTRLAMIGMKVEDLESLPKAKNQKALAAIRILSSVATAAYWSKSSLLPLIIFKVVTLSIKNGNADLSPYHYAGYGMILCTIGKIEQGYRFGHMAISLVDKMESGDQKAKTIFVFNAFIRHWKEPAENSLKPLLVTSALGLESGDLEFAAHASMLYCWISWQAGRNLGILIPQIKDQISLLKNLRQNSQLHLAQMALQVTNDLTREDIGSGFLSGEFYDEIDMYPIHLKAGDRTAIATLFSFKMVLNYIFGNYQQALKSADMAKEYLDGFTSLLMFAGNHFYDSLVRLASFNLFDKKDKKKALAVVEKNQKKMKKWALHSPANFLHKYYLVHAELLRVKGKTDNVLEFYLKAASLAQQNNYLQDEAFAYELAARFIISIGNISTGKTFIKEAREAYLRWGALGKAKHLEQSFPKIFEIKKENTSRPFQEPDYIKLINALAAISTEIIFEKLLDMLLLNIVEIAGAGRVVFISVRDGKLLVQAERIVNPGLDRSKDIVRIKQIPIDNKKDLVHSVINYVKNSLKHMVVENALSHRDFIGDLYVQSNGAKSILCMPVIRQSVLNGIIYLENNSAPGIFTPDRIHVLQLIASQAAISIENAMLYENLKQTEQALRESVEKYRLLAENVTDNLWTLDIETLTYTYQSPSLEKVFGYTAEEIIGQGFKKLLPPKSLEIAMDIFQEELEAEVRGNRDPDRSRLIQLKVLKKDGSEIWVESTIRLLRDESGKAFALLGVSRDITARKNAEEEIKKLNAELELRVEQRTMELQQSLDNLKNTQKQLVQSEKMAALGGLVAGVAHEINTPLGIGVTASTFLLAKTEEYEKTICREEKDLPQGIIKYMGAAKEASTIIHTNLNRAANLINSFKNVAVDQTSLTKRRFNLYTYINDILRSLSPEYVKKGLRIDVNCPDYLEINSYPGLFSQIITNLVMNSIIHGFDNGLIKGEMYIEAAIQDDMLYLKYKDNGKGMDSKTRSRIFDPFFTTNRNQGGTGLGMHIVFNLVNQSLGGTISCKSRPDQGVLFAITLPLDN